MGRYCIWSWTVSLDKLNSWEVVLVVALTRRWSVALVFIRLNEQYIKSLFMYSYQGPGQTPAHGPTEARQLNVAELNKHVCCGLRIFFLMKQVMLHLHLTTMQWQQFSAVHIVSNGPAMHGIVRNRYSAAAAESDSPGPTSCSLIHSAMCPLPFNIPLGRLQMVFWTPEPSWGNPCKNK